MRITTSIRDPQTRWCLLIVAISSMAGIFGPQLFPHAVGTIINWQISQAGTHPSSQDLVVIELDSQGPFSCGTNTWNRTRLADMMTALQEANASVIALLVPLHDLATLPCGGIVGDAKLVESLHHHNIVIPADSATVFTQAATRVGHTTLRLDPDGVLRLRPSRADNPGKSLPYWGNLVSQIHREKIFNDTRITPHQSSNSRWIRWSDQTYRTIPDTNIWSMKRLDVRPVHDLVWDNIVVLLPKDNNQAMIPTPLGIAMQEPYVHIEGLQDALADSSISRVSVEFLAIVVCLVGWKISALLMFHPRRKGLITILVMSTLYGILMWGLLVTVGIALPILSLILTVSCATTLIVLRNMWLRHSQAHAIRTQLEQNILTLQQELRVKEQRTAVLACLLQAPKQGNGASSTPPLVKRETLTRAHQEWREAREEIERSRSKLEELEAQLSSLRQKQSPYIPGKDKHLGAELTVLQKECQAMGIVTQDPQVLQMFKNLKKAANTSAPILLTGETGTGKEIFANAVHRLSSRAAGPLIALNTAAIRSELFESELFGHARGAYTGAVGAKGLLEAAANGTLFLDEIGEIPLQVQAKLLRLLEDGTYYRVGEARSRTADVRILAATNRDLQHEIQAGRFRSDLYFRLNAFCFHLPSLRERIPEDRQLLAQVFIQDISRQLGRGQIRLSQGAMEAICSAPWPGNIRELKHTLAQAATLTDAPVITEDTLQLKELPLDQGRPDDIADRTGPASLTALSGRTPLCEDHTVLAVLREHRFDIQASAKSLGRDRSTVTQRLKGLGFQTLVRHHGNLEAAAMELAGEASLVPRVRAKLRDYYRNLTPDPGQPGTIEEAMASCRQRMKNLPDRYFTAIETLIRWSRQTESTPSSSSSLADS